MTRKLCNIVRPTLTHWLLQASLTVLFASSLSAQDTTSQGNVTGRWLARNFRPAAGMASLTFVMDIRHTGADVHGEIRWEQAGAFAAAGAPTTLNGLLVADSLFLRDVTGAPILEGRVEGRRYSARIAIVSSRLGGPISLIKLGPEAKSIRFERQ